MDLHIVLVDHLQKIEKLSVRLRTKWLWVRVPLQSLKQVIPDMFIKTN